MTRPPELLIVVMLRSGRDPLRVICFAEPEVHQVAALLRFSEHPDDFIFERRPYASRQQARSQPLPETKWRRAAAQAEVAGAHGAHGARPLSLSACLCPFDDCACGGRA